MGCKGCDWTDSHADRDRSGPGPPDERSAPMRINFLSRLALLVGAAFLVVVTQAWSGGTLEWLFIVGGIVMLAPAAVDFTAAPGAQRRLDAAPLVLRVWS